MTLSRRLATLTVGALTVGWLAAGCAGSSEQTSSDDQPASADAADGDLVDCRQLEDASASEESPSTDQLPLRATGPIATVDGQDVSADDFNQFARKRMPTQHRKMPKPLADRMKRKMSQKLVEQQLIQRTLDDASVRIEKSALENRFADFKSRFPDDNALQAFLDQRNTTEDQLRAQLCRDVQMEKYLDDKYEQVVDDDAIADYYEENKDEFETPEKVKASHILLRVSKDASPEDIESLEEKAQKLADKAREEGTDFAKLAKKHSDGPSASRGGDLGFFSHRRMVADFSDVAFDMEPGEISDPVRTKFGFHVIKMHERQEAEAKSLDEAREQIQRRLSQQSRRTAMQRFLEDAKNDLSVEYHLDNIEVNVETAEAGDGNTLPSPPGGAQ